MDKTNNKKFNFFISGLIENYDSVIDKFENAFNDEYDIPTDDQRLRQFEHFLEKIVSIILQHTILYLLKRSKKKTYKQLIYL